MKVKNQWRIECNHTPEIIDRIVMPIRKRGIGITKLNYEKEKKADKGTCTLEFEVEELDGQRIFKNLLRITDILKVEIIYDK